MIAPETPPVLNRRDAVKTAVLLGGVLALGATLEGCARGDATATAGATTLSAEDTALLEELADTLLPTTPSSPGARAAGAGAAMTLLLTDCYPAQARATVTRGLEALRAECQAKCNGAYTKLSPSQRETLLLGIDAEARKAGDGHWFSIVREAALRAYFSSEVGMTKALRYVRVPGRWTGCVTLEPGQPAWG